MSSSRKAYATATDEILMLTGQSTRQNQQRVCRLSGMLPCQTRLAPHIFSRSARFFHTQECRINDFWSTEDETPRYCSIDWYYPDGGKPGLSWRNVLMG